MCLIVWSGSGNGARACGVHSLADSDTHSLTVNVTMTVTNQTNGTPPTLKLNLSGKTLRLHCTVTVCTTLQCLPLTVHLWALATHRSHWGGGRWPSGECWLGLATGWSWPGSNPAAATPLRNFGNSVLLGLCQLWCLSEESRRSLRSGVYVGRNLWICEIHGYRCAIYGSLARARIHGCLRNLWILRRVRSTELLLFLIFSHFYVGSMCLMRLLHLARSCVSSLDNSFSDKSFLMLSIHLLFGLPLLLFPGTSIAITLLPTYSSSLLSTCPYHFNLLSCTFLDISPTFVVPLILSFLILSSLVTPLIHLNILISATSNFFSCAFFTAQVSAPYIIAGLTTVLYTFPLTLKLILRSHRIPDTLFQFFHPDCILCVISASLL